MNSCELCGRQGALHQYGAWLCASCTSGELQTDCLSLHRVERRELTFQHVRFVDRIPPLDAVFTQRGFLLGSWSGNDDQDAFEHDVITSTGCPETTRAFLEVAECREAVRDLVKEARCVVVDRRGAWARIPPGDAQGFSAFMALVVHLRRFSGQGDRHAAVA